jgi:hypothetical protein
MGAAFLQIKQTMEELIKKLKKKIDAKEIAEILIKPFLTLFFGPRSLCNYDTWKRFTCS